MQSHSWSHSQHTFQAMDEVIAGDMEDIQRIKAQIEAKKQELRAHESRGRNLLHSLEMNVALKQANEIQRVALRDALDVLESLSESTATNQGRGDSSYKRHQKLSNDTKVAKRKLDIKIRGINRAILTLDAQHGDIKGEMEEQKTSLEACRCVLEMKERTLQNREQLLRNNRNLRNPIHLISDEVLQEIFLIRIREDEAAFEASRRFGSPPFTALTFFLVNKKWRSAILRRPSLWQYVAIPRSNHLTQAQVDRLLHYLQYVENLPPIVYTYIPEKTPNDAPYDFSSVLASLPPCQTLDLHIEGSHPPEQDFIIPALADASPHADTLRLINTRLSTPGRPFSCEVPASAVKHVSSLYAIDVSIALPARSVVEQVNMLEIKSLTIAGTFTTKDLQTALVHLERLEELRLDGAHVVENHGDTRVRSPLMFVRCTLVQYSVLRRTFASKNWQRLELSAQDERLTLFWVNTFSNSTAESGILSLTIAEPSAAVSTDDFHDMHRAALLHFKEITCLTLCGDHGIRGLGKTPNQEIPLARLETVKILNRDVGSEVMEEFKARFFTFHRRPVKVVEEIGPNN
ncbi:SubName: Full=Uncharacterized protein {ECO:0000313/EMBL:CCA71608.1} [Serendipita indica DSM 11827]|uniref:Uncharacterized protein n=1 Tax=Serendipita indica (strain DSM 11827) TaxID=1109443 RepID=G4TJW5_SERID|nr:SubName: Full=Uncharacterized protein {ECO:0000313/EMBL:CCA71608.1} [Serendipita indica DSM 11827]CCA71608.1 hypothetical protein PIIN_05544 [Serendipita indica DSM 11827]